ncbi:hypothetical protein QR680_002127 [Steinernema hermaphroditum]|uniref:Uncharacterized protein n=1 Tax=Steinernema hermaphroditum TaxID=289476 RepID=A0AA39H1D3_9BILA|nr:hypothetical protein QR680_002127 [Steinernema hermaphroditum]
MASLQANLITFHRNRDYFCSVPLHHSIIRLTFHQLNESPEFAGFYSTLCFQIIFHDYQSNELIVETFENLDFGFNSHSIHQLIAAVVVFVVISALLAVTVIIFRIYVYCRNDANTRQYQLPTYDTKSSQGSPSAHGHSRSARNSFHAAFMHTVEDV